MSDNYLRLVPYDPYWLPNPEAVIESLSVLRDFLSEAETINAESKKYVTFFDAGGNSSCVTCPSCGFDLQGWWKDAMEKAWKVGFKNLAITTPCCQAPTSLNDLIYDWPAAFGRFSLVVTNPGVAFIASERLKEVELAIRAVQRWSYCFVGEDAVEA